MTEAYRKWWLEFYGKTKPNPFPDENTHFWIRAFVQEVRDMESNETGDLEIAFNKVVFKFGLDSDLRLGLEKERG